MWSVRLRALNLALGEPLVTVAESHPERLKQGWQCGCSAISADYVNCYVSVCDVHGTLFPPQTAVDSGPRSEAN